MKETNKVDHDLETDSNSDGALLDWHPTLFDEKKVAEKRSRGMKRSADRLDDSDEKEPKIARTQTHTLTPFSKREFKSMCRPRYICTAIAEFNHRQKEAIEEIGFRGFLRMNIQQTPLDLYGWLLDAFNPNNGVVYVNDRPMFQVSKNDVRDIFLLPNEGSLVREAQTRAERVKLRKSLQEKYKVLGKGNEMTLEKTMVVMKQLRNGCDDFKRFFIMYVVSCFLAPTSNRKIRTGILGALTDVSKIPKMDWCKYVLDHLCNRIQVWRRDDRKQHVGGCLMVLQVCYLQRHSWWGEVLPKDLPLIQNLDGDNVKERIDQELLSGGFGLGIFELEGYPISKKESGKVGSIRKITWEVDFDLLMDSDIERMYPNEFDSSLSKVRRDLEMFNRINMPRLMSSDSNASDSCTREVLSLTQDIDKMVDSLQKLKGHVLERTKLKAVYRASLDSPKPMQTNSVEVDQCYVPNIDALLIDNPVEDANWAVPYEDPIASSVRSECHVEGLQQAEQHLLVSPTSSPQVSGSMETQLCKIVESFGSEILSQRNTCESIESSRDVRVQEILDELKSMEDVHFSSELLKEYPSNMKQLQKHDAIISDFCIAKRDRYVLFSDGDACVVDANDFSSLGAGEFVSSMILNAFVRTINASTPKASKPSMVCLDVIPNYGPFIVDSVVFTLWDGVLEKSKREFLSSDMVLVPVLVNEHFFAVVANVKKSKFQYLDSLTHVHTIGEWMNRVVSLRKLVSDYMIKRGHHKAGEVEHYEIETVGGRWRNETGNGDCGVYVMHHMRHFRGDESFDNDNLMTVRKRNVLRAQMCAKIIRSRVNNRSLSVLEAVLEHHQSSKA